MPGLCEALHVPWLRGRSQDKQIPQRSRTPQITNRDYKPVISRPSPQRWWPSPQGSAHSWLVGKPNPISSFKMEATHPCSCNRGIQAIQAKVQGVIRVKSSPQRLTPLDTFQVQALGPLMAQGCQCGRTNARWRKNIPCV